MRASASLRRCLSRRPPGPSPPHFREALSGESFMDTIGKLVFNYVRAEVLLSSPSHCRASVRDCSLSQLAEIPADRRDTRDPLQAVLDNFEYLSQHGRQGVLSHWAAAARADTERQLFRVPRKPFQPYTESAVSASHPAGA